VLPATRQRCGSHIYPQPKQVLDLATPGGMQGCVVLCYVKADRLGFQPSTCQLEVQHPTTEPTCNTITLFISQFFYVCTCIFQKTKGQISPHFLYMLPMAMAPSSTGSNAIRYVLRVCGWHPVFHIMQGIEQNRRRHVCFVHFAKWRHQLGIRWRRSIEIARWRLRGRSMPSPTAFCCCVDTVELPYLSS